MGDGDISKQWDQTVTKTHRQKWASKMVNMWTNITSFFSSLKDMKMYKEIIMTHKNSTEEGRKNPVTMEKN